MPEIHAAHLDSARRLRAGSLVMSITLKGRALLLWLAIPACGWADEPAASDSTDERAARLQQMQNSMAEYSFTIGARAEPVELRTAPVLRFTNPIRRTSDGALFVWQHEGRPVALTCIYPGGRDIWDHEFQSLSEQSLNANRGSRSIWRPTPGVRFVDVPETAAAAMTVPARRRELGSISRRFSARLLGWGEGSRKNDELRLQDNPVHRWGNPNGPAIDGAMFLFGEATDPEVVLLLEAHRHEERLVWKYAVARVTTAELSVRIDDTEVWHIPPWDFDPRPDQPYLTLNGQTLPELKRPTAP